VPVPSLHRSEVVDKNNGNGRLFGRSLPFHIRSIRSWPEEENYHRGKEVTFSPQVIRVLIVDDPAKAKHNELRLIKNLLLETL
jgi:hypothetical protein